MRLHSFPPLDMAEPGARDRLESQPASPVMPRLRWLPSFAIGIPSIDADHQDLLDLVNALMDAAEAADPTPFHATARALAERAEAHFLHEETVLRDRGLPHAESHHHNHRALARTGWALAERSALAAMPGDETMLACLDGFRRFVVDDIIKGDMQLKSDLQGLLGGP